MIFHFIFSAAIAFVAAIMLTKCRTLQWCGSTTIDALWKIHHSLQWRNVGDGSV